MAPDRPPARLPAVNLLTKALGRHRFQPPPATEVIASWLLALFLALGPVYWLPGISTEMLLRPFEWGILLVALVLVFGTELLRGRLPFPAGLLGPLGFAGILLFWIPGLAQAKTGDLALEFVVKLGLTAALFWCFFCIARGGGDVFAVFRRAFSIVVLLAGAALIAALVGTVDWSFPCLWESSYVNGLGATSTGWSIGLAIFVPLAALFLLPGESRRPLTSSFSSLLRALPSFPRRGESAAGGKRVNALGEMKARLGTGMTAAALGVIVLLGGQLVSGGRAGILVSVLTIGAFTLLPATRRLAVIVVLAGLLAGLVYADESCTYHLRVHYLSNAVEAAFSSEANPAQPELYSPITSATDNFTGRRAQGYALGISKIKERPLLGHGLLQVIVKYPKHTEIHNLWLKWGVYTGLAAPILLAVIMALIVRAWWRTFRDKLRPATERLGAAALGLVILAGLVISMLEINILVGAFQISAAFWAAAGALVGIAARSPQLAVRPPPGSGQETAQ